jgi:hypothetical protein
MPRKPKTQKPGAEILAPIPAELLDQLVRDGPSARKRWRPRRDGLRRR